MPPRTTTVLLELTVEELRLVLSTDADVPDPNPRLGRHFKQRELKGTALRLDVKVAPDEEDVFPSLRNDVLKFLRDRAGADLDVEIKRRDVPVIDDQTV